MEPNELRELCAVACVSAFILTADVEEELQRYDERYYCPGCRKRVQTPGYCKKCNEQIPF